MALLQSLMAVAVAGAPVMDRPVGIGTGAKALHGTLTTPTGVTASAAVLIINGSGPTDRDGNDLKDGARGQPARLLALALSQRGVVSLRYDKRGVGDSEGAGDPTSIGQLADDAAAWIRLLKAQEGVRCVVIVGHSEGALVGALASQQERLCGLAAVNGASQNLGDLIEAQGAVVRRSPEVSAKIHEIILALRSGATVRDVPPGYEGVFGPKTVEYTRSQISLDPVAEFAKVTAPVMIIQGDNDLQETVESAKRLAAAVHVQPVIISGMTHALKLAAKDVKANIETYTNPDLPLAPSFVQAITEFVLSRR